jgi:tetratricopeptide (TPR) repeat protein
MRLLITIFTFCFMNSLLFSQSNKVSETHKDKAIDELISGNKQKALIEINQAIKLYPNNADYHYIIGNVIEKMNDLNNALVAYKKSISLNPKHSDATMKCGIILAKLNNKKKACEYFKKACELGENKACEINNKFCN